MTDASNDYAPLAGLAVYLWHCDRSGRYSMYSSGVEDENYLRGIAETDGDGTALVQDDLPRLLLGPLAAHPLRGLLVGRQGRRQRPDRQDVADRAAAGGRARRSTRPADTPAALSNLAQTSLSTDNVFSDDRAIHQLATVTGSVEHGFVANLTIGI